MHKPVTVLDLERSNVSDPLNQVVVDVLEYAIEHEVSVVSAIEDLDYPVAADLFSLIKEAGEYVLNSYYEYLLREGGTQ